MYEEYFGLSGQPFKLNPDPKFFYGSQSHNKAMAYLHYGLRQGEGFIVITGEIGAGKSMLIGHLLDQIDRSNVVAADLITPNLKREDLLAHILSAYRVEPAGEGPTAEIEAFEDYLFDQMNRGRRVLLIVDEAQNLPVDTLEELRVLSNLDYDGTPLFQVFLVGQPEFKKVIGGDGMEQLRQRIIASYHLEPLNLEESRSYIEHRMRVVGWDDNPTITDEAFALVHEATGGVPRNINKLFNRLLLFCALEKRDVISGEVVRAVIDDLAAEDVSGNPMTLGPAIAGVEREPTQGTLTDEPLVEDVAEDAPEDVVEADNVEDEPVEEMDAAPEPAVFEAEEDVADAVNDAVNAEAVENEDYQENEEAAARVRAGGPNLRLVSDRDNSDRDSEDDSDADADPFAIEDAPEEEPAAFAEEGETAMRITPEHEQENDVDEMALMDDEPMAINEPEAEDILEVIEAKEDSDLHADDDADGDADDVFAMADDEAADDQADDSEDDDVIEPVAAMSQSAPAAPLSVLDRLRGGQDAPSAEETVAEVAASAAPAYDAPPATAEPASDEPVSDTTINDVADAIAAATEKARAQGALGDDDDVQALAEFDADDAAFDEPAVEAPAPSSDPVTLERWRAALSRTVTSTRHDLKEAHTTALRLRARLRDIESRRQQSKEKVAESLDRAEALLSELRDVWK